jgi:hypothetical protein
MIESPGNSDAVEFGVSFLSLLLVSFVRTASVLTVASAKYCQIGDKNQETNSQTEDENRSSLHGYLRGAR